jgi:DNA-directed RNA polymerase subunit RPC12/RpoP
MKLMFAKRINECPRCESTVVRRSMRKGFVEHFLYPLFFVWPYRCDDCDMRFLGFHRQYVPARVSAPVNRGRA